jgi:class 3 adenylate cyclase
VDRPETRFAWNGDSALAYQVLEGNGPDLLYLQGWISNIELSWDHPTLARFLRGLGRGRRLIMTDPRGEGCSERSSPHDVWPLEMILEDLEVVLDQVGSERVTILATDQLGFVACMFAATFPDRTNSLILYKASANYLRSEETPWEWTEEHFAEQEADLRTWTSRTAFLDDLKEVDPSSTSDPSYADWWRRYNMLSEGLGSGIASARKYMHTDIRPILGTIHVPVLVLSRPGQSGPEWAPSARFLARRIPGARLHELPGRDTSLWLGDQASVFQSVDGFLQEVGREQSDLERVLATVLFTDIVGSTERAASLGDRAWRDVLERHHERVRALLQRFRGIEVDTAGDGFLARFDGPARGVRCARAIIEEMHHLGIEVRAGLHTGEVEMIDGKVGGLAVHIGARIGALAKPSEVLVSQTVKDLVTGSGLAFEDAGEHDLKGVPGPWRLFRVTQ